MFRIIGADGKEYGPISAEQIRQWMSEGRVNVATQVRPEGAAEWRSLSDFPEFLPRSAPPTFPTGYTPPFCTPGTGGSAASTRTNGLAIAGFVTSLLSLPGGFFCLCMFPVCSVAAVILSICALVQIKQEPMSGGRGLAIAGLIIGVLELLATLLALLVPLLFVGWAGSHSNL